MIKNTRITAGGWVVSILLLTIPVLAQEQDLELKRVTEMARTAWAEIDRFAQAGGKEGTENYPGRKWGPLLWKYREEHPGTAAATKATGEAIHLMYHSGPLEEVTAKVETLSPRDRAWERVIDVVLEAAQSKRDYSYLIKKAQFVLADARDNDVRGRVHFALGLSCWKTGDLERAKSAFQAVIAEIPKSPRAKEAKGNIFEISYLNAGQLAPSFSARTIDGREISLGDFNGRTVLLVYWATW
jgi:tetratricopeptide (TPR) repeat protein